MADTTPREQQPTPVTIYGRTYHLRGSGDTDYLAKLADIVDSTMKQVAQSTGTADTLKVAILAALNIADERVQAEDESGAGLSGKADSRLEALVHRIEEALADDPLADGKSADRPGH
ncbi:hypothetical protein ABI59_02830 [Acidobacteria bacterium Mor1]|nr:hypothetical protein ABI59_02830 [Acidobacteria bacterium Mor1]